VVLVTGGTGFLGSVLIKQLVDSGVDIRAIRRDSSAIPPSLLDHPRIQWVEADITDFFALEEAFEGVTQVYHCAAFVSFDPRDRTRMLNINVAGTAYVVTLALERGARLVHVSSVAAVGDPKSGSESTEDDLWEYSPDRSAYSVSKYESEQEVWRGIAEGLNAVIVNPSIIIGRTARSGSNGSSGTLFTTIQKGLDFYTLGGVGLVDVEDVARAMVLLMDNPAIRGERFLLNSANVSNRELLATCSEYLGRPVPRFRATPFMLGLAWRAARWLSLFTGRPPVITKDIAKAASKRRYFSNAKIRSATGMEFRPIDDTLREICTTLQKNTDSNKI